MAVLSSQVERGSDDFSRRYERMAAVVAELRERTAQVARGGDERAVERHRARGKLPREHLTELPDGDQWISNDSRERFGLVAFGRRAARPGPARQDPDVAEEFDVE